MSDLRFDWDEVDTTRDHYDFSEAQKNPYAKRLKKQVTIRLDESTLEYFHALASERDGDSLPDLDQPVPAGLRAAHQKKLSIQWEPAA